MFQVVENMVRRKKPEIVMKDEYKVYEGMRCVLVIIPVKIRKEADINAGDYVSFEYDKENDKIFLSPRRVL